MIISLNASLQTRDEVEHSCWHIRTANNERYIVLTDDESIFHKRLPVFERGIVAHMLTTVLRG